MSSWKSYEYGERVDDCPLPTASDNGLGNRGLKEVDCLPALVNPLEAIIGHCVASQESYRPLLAALLTEHRHALNDLLCAGRDPLDIAPVVPIDQLMQLKPVQRDDGWGFELQMMQRQARLLGEDGMPTHVALVPFGSQPGEHEPKIIQLQGSVKAAPEWVRQMHTEYWEMQRDS